MPEQRWQFIAGPATGGHELALTEARSRKYTARLNAPSEVSFTVDGRHPQAAAIGELSTDIHLLWTPDEGPTQQLGRCRVGGTGDTLGADSHTVEVTALDYRAVLNRRRLYSTSQLTWTATDQAEIAWGLLQQTQTRPGGDLRIIKGVGFPTRIARDRTYAAGDSIGERIQELAEVLDGFDWDITPDGPSALRLDVYHPQRGTDRGVVLEYGGLVASVRREVDPSEYANAIRMSGDDSASPPPTPQEREAPDIATRPEGRWDAVYGETSIQTQAALNDRATWQLAQAQRIQPGYTLTLRRGGWDGPAHLWLGDPVRIVINSGRLAVDTTLRVHEIDFTVADDGGETIQVTVGAPRPDFRRSQLQFIRRLVNVERVRHR